MRSASCLSSARSVNEEQGASLVGTIGSSLLFSAVLIFCYEMYNAVLFNLRSLVNMIKRLRHFVVL